MNIVLATPNWSLNGPNVFSANLARSLNARGESAHILITRPDWADSKPLPRPGDVPIRELPLRRRFLSGRFRPASRRWEAMLQYLEDRAPCIYVPNHDFSHSCISPALSPGVAICGIAHSDDPQHYEHVGRLGRYWNSVVAVSPAIRGRLARQFPSMAPRLSLIPYGVPLPASPCIRPPVRRALRALYAGRLDQAQKRVLELPKIVSAAAELGVAIELTIAGGGPEEEELRKACHEFGVHSKVHFAGILDAARMSEVYAAHDVFLLTSAFEGLPLSLLEAMGQGCVPLAPDLRSGVPETIQHGINGFICKSGDAAAYARCLRLLENAPEVRAAMALRAWETAYARFRLETMADRYGKLFERLLTERFVRPAGKIEASPAIARAERLHRANSLASLLRR